MATHHHLSGKTLWLDVCSLPIFYGASAWVSYEVPKSLCTSLLSIAKFFAWYARSSCRNRTMVSHTLCSFPSIHPPCPPDTSTVGDRWRPSNILFHLAYCPPIKRREYKYAGTLLCVLQPRTPRFPVGWVAQILRT